MKFFERIFIVIEGSIEAIIDRLKKLLDLLRGLDDDEIVRIMKKMKEHKVVYFKRRQTTIIAKYPKKGESIDV